MKDNKFMQYFLAALGFLGKYLEVLVPKAKGWKTMFVNGLTTIITAVELFDLVDILDRVCGFYTSIGDTFGYEWACSSAAIAGGYYLFVGFLNLVLRTVTDSPVGEA